MAAFTRYEDIHAWEQGRALVRSVYGLTCSPLFAKDYGLKDQVQRAAVSVCSNIAEGFERRGNAEFIKFLWIAKGSAAEVSSQLYHAYDVGYITEADFKRVYNEAKLVAGTIYNLIHSIQTSQKGPSFTR